MVFLYLLNIDFAMRFMDGKNCTNYNSSSSIFLCYALEPLETLSSVGVTTAPAANRLKKKTFFFCQKVLSRYSSSDSPLCFGSVATAQKMRSLQTYRLYSTYAITINLQYCTYPQYPVRTYDRKK